jgi:hypothetical protein
MEKFKPQKDVHYGKKMLTVRAKPIRINGDPDNQRPDKRSSTVLASKSLS